MSRPRSAPLVLDQGPSSNALRAALTARSTSALSPSATWQIGSPVQGLSVANVLPDALCTHLPLMNIGSRDLTGGRLTTSFFGAAAVTAMVYFSWCVVREGREVDCRSRRCKRQGNRDLCLQQTLTQHADSVCDVGDALVLVADFAFDAKRACVAGFF